MRIVADRTAFAHGRVLIDKGPCLLPMTICARLVHARHGESTRRFHDVHAVRIVALNTIHFAFENGMMLRKMKLRLNIQVALKARLGFLAGIDNVLFEASAPAHRYVSASWPVAGFAAGLAAHARMLQPQPRMRAGGKSARNLLVAVGTGLVAYVCGAFNR